MVYYHNNLKTKAMYSNRSSFLDFTGQTIFIGIDRFGIRIFYKFVDY